MKNLVLILTLVTSTIGFAQDQAIRTRIVKKPKTNAQQGVYVGLDYMNLTDVHAKVSAKTPYGNFSDSTESGTALQMAGLTIGYNQTPDTGLGFSAGSRFLENFIDRKGETNQKLQMIVPEANLTFAATSNFILYGGANLSFWRASETDQTYEAQIGGQAGLAFRFTKDIALNMGYTVLNQKASTKTSDMNADFELQLSGFTSNLIYTF
jgi:hypothetical protein